MRPIHPGKMLLEYLDSKDMYQAELARRTGLTPKHINRVVKGLDRVTVKMALKLEPVLGRPAHFWTNLQQRWDLAKARKRKRKQ